MKQLTCLMLFLLSTLAYSQTIISSGKKDKLIYLDSTYTETNKKNHKFYRIIKDYDLEKDLYVINDYYKSGVLQMEGSSKTKEKILNHGEFVYYFQNGNKQKYATYAAGKAIGKTTSWYEDGHIKEEGEYISNYETLEKRYKVNQYWDKSNNHLIIDGNGSYSMENNGKYKDGFKDGIHQGKNIKNNTSFVEEYKDGKFISGTRTFSDNTTSKYFVLEKIPIPKKGMGDFYSFVAKNFIIPKGPTKNQYSGRILIRFVVDENGKIVDPKIIEGINYLYDFEAIRVLREYGDWLPGEQRGEKVRCNYSLPISIQSEN